VLAIEPFDMAEPVKDAPYSADIVTEIVQQLPDGNRIERRSTSTVARDTDGRVRREQQLAAIGPFLPQRDSRVVTITDPVGKVHYSLDAVRKVAMRSPLMFTKRIERPATSHDAEHSQSSSVGHDADATHFQLRVPATATPQQVHTEMLGTMELSGVPAEGTRTTLTIEAGAIGNQAPISVVTESWYSPELKTIVLSRRTDPRFGETTYRLENIVRAEPAADLFQVPPDYKIDKMQPFGEGTFHVGAVPPR
jgi:hypothetical protein